MIPTTIRTPGSYHEFAFLKAAGSLTPLPQRINLIGVQSDAPASTATVNEPVQVLNETDADTKFGTGSELALMCRAAFATAAVRGLTPEIWATPLADGATTAAVQTITVTGPSTEAGDVVLRIAGRTMRVSIVNGETANDTASKIKDAIDEITETLPVTATVATNVVTCTHVNKGVNGNDVAYSTVSTPAGISLAYAQTFAGAGDVSISASLDNTLDKNYYGIAIANHKTGDISTLITHCNSAWNFDTKRYRWAFVGETGSLGTVQALSAVSKEEFEIVVVGYRGSPSLPSEIAAVMATLAFSAEAPNYNYDGAQVPLYPPTASNVWTTGQAGEIESLLASGVTPLYPVTGRDDRSSVVKLITSQYELSSAPYFRTSDITVSRTSAWLAEQIDIRHKADFSQEIITDDVLDRIVDMVIAIQDTAEELRYLRNVDDRIGSIKATINPGDPNRVDVINPHEPVPPLHITTYKHNALT